VAEHDHGRVRLGELAHRAERALERGIEIERRRKLTESRQAPGLGVGLAERAPKLGEQGFGSLASRP
jgi:hypothetical protein